MQQHEQSHEDNRQVLCHLCSMKQNNIVSFDVHSIVDHFNHTHLATVEWRQQHLRRQRIQKQLSNNNDNVSGDSVSGGEPQRWSLGAEECELHECPSLEDEWGACSECEAAYFQWSRCD